jgi:hypothetical protein
MNFVIVETHINQTKVLPPILELWNLQKYLNKTNKNISNTTKKMNKTNKYNRR